jgi:hypothetical protein
MTMSSLADTRYIDSPDSEVDYFGFQIRVRSPRLAALLNGDDDAVQVQRLAPDEGVRERATDPGSGARGPRDAGERRSGVVVEFHRPGSGS